MAKRRKFGQRGKGREKKPVPRGIREFESDRGALMHGVGKLMRKMGLHDLAGDIIRQNKLATSRGGRAILRLGLQKAFLQGLWKTGKRGDIASQSEKTLVQLIADAETIRATVWRAFTEKTAIKKTEKVFSAVAEIMQMAQSELKGSNQKLARYCKKIGQDAKTSASMIRAEIAGGALGHAESLNERQLLWAARIGEKMIFALSEKLPNDSKTGFILIENIVKTELGEKRND